ncbi:o-succinylbenzoate synthase [Echinicola marina]|uniref:o-succinylbenzoate synthase n=1 Tax=Echinicola marina TaxID=2859768 RepID=UPI001CF6C3E1|nr:o-succinylbenzoate synthase [Echinicola marina]UCS92822.1 o-succinylbenzoate synthase [Echinicola marina]
MSNTFRLDVAYKKHRLDFRFDAGTSRGVLKSKDTYFVSVGKEGEESVKGWGEAGPLPKLSIDDILDFEEILNAYVGKLKNEEFKWSQEGILDFCHSFVSDEHPSIRFAFETALLDLFHGGKKQILENAFYSENQSIDINGLIWMGDVNFMLQQIEEKLKAGFSCIKMKIGAIDFEQELSLLAHIRKNFSADEITLRVDANGSFSPSDALTKLDRLAKFDLHSIEQPIKAGQTESMAELCEQSPLDIALDEELIGVGKSSDRKRLLEIIRPPYIILKPTLVGGIKDTKEWIALAEELGIGWWMTSALESNIGLNAISQLTSSYNTTLPQGLGTGQLYHNNIASPLEVKEGKIFYNPEIAWDKA